MNIDTLKLFIDVAHELSFTNVANEKNVDASSVSRAIANLEAHLSLRLFNRTTRQMTLTEVGERYLKSVRHVVEEYEQAEEQVRSFNRTPTGTLRLTASVAFGECMLIPLIKKFNDIYPKIKLELILTDNNIDLVSNGIDLAIRLSSSLQGDLIATKLIDTRYRVVASPDYINNTPTLTTPKDLATHDCTLFSLPSYGAEWKFKAIKGSNKEIKPIAISKGIVISSAISIRSHVRSGGQPALLADWLIRDDLMSGHLIDLFPNYDVTATTFDTAEWLLYPSRAYLPQKVRVTIDFLKAHIGPRTPLD
ncbi:LysR family transcriptional regulator [Agaribacter marinus]|uniref:LysR family transcriptional regulator n=1 Tax=Agaribacter marinus TaxID=1431249 RepID=A0AA37SY26_9ALTE|nr:LysR family transcriptional regulator [Agaribacter marinus]GLR71967.1 LysR family transcriptional regulator [Agaribacter marinus]